MKLLQLKLQKRRLEWLGHLARMSDYRMPKITLFSWLPQPCPSCGPKRRWRDVAKKDMQAANIATDTWHEEARNRRGWYEAHNEGVLSHLKQQKKRQQEERTMECSICLRLLRRAADKARHKCTSERVKPGHEQRDQEQRRPSCSQIFHQCTAGKIRVSIKCAVRQ